MAYAVRKPTGNGSAGWAFGAAVQRKDEDDPWYQKARLVAESFPPNERPAARLARLARHLEAKLAVRMSDGDHETVVIDRDVCGTRDFDRGDPFACDKLLVKFLPRGSSLTIIEYDENRRTYHGRDDA